VIGQRIKQLRKDLYVNQSDFEAAIGLTKGVLSRIESGKTKTINSDIIKKIVLVYNLPVEKLFWLITGSDISKKSNDESELLKKVNDLKEKNDKLQREFDDLVLISKNISMALAQNKCGDNKNERAVTQIGSAARSGARV